MVEVHCGVVRTSKGTFRVHTVVSLEGEYVAAWPTCDSKEAASATWVSLTDLRDGLNLLPGSRPLTHSTHSAGPSVLHNIVRNKSAEAGTSAGRSSVHPSNSADGTAAYPTDGVVSAAAVVALVMAAVWLAVQVAANSATHLSAEAAAECARQVQRLAHALPVAHLEHVDMLLDSA